MATTFQWVAPEAIVTHIGATLNSLANLATASNGPVIANETGLFQYISFELVLAALSPTAGAYVDLWALYALDGSNFADSAKASQTSGLLCSFQLDLQPSLAQRLTRSNVLIAPLDFKLELRNGAGVALAASGSTLKYRRHNDQGV